MSRASLSPGVVEELIDGGEVGLFLGRFSFGDARIERRPEFFQRLLGLVHVHFRPQRMVVAHGLAPVGHREIGIELLRLLEGQGGFVELEAMQFLHALDEAGLRCGGAGGGEADDAELLRAQLGRQKQARSRQGH